MLRVNRAASPRVHRQSKLVVSASSARARPKTGEKPRQKGNVLVQVLKLCISFVFDAVLGNSFCIPCKYQLGDSVEMRYWDTWYYRIHAHDARLGGWQQRPAGSFFRPSFTYHLLNSSISCVQRSFMTALSVSRFRTRYICWYICFLQMGRWSLDW